MLAIYPMITVSLSPLFLLTNMSISFFMLSATNMAIGSFILSTAYEGEIYFQNLKGAWKKLFQYNYLQRELARQFLLDKVDALTKDDIPEFFKDYKKQLKKIADLKKETKKNPSSRKKMKEAKKILRNMDKRFTQHLFRNTNSKPKSSNKYISDLQLWLKNNGQEKLQNLYYSRYYTFHAVKAFSFITMIFMGLSTSYLLAETIASIPWLSAYVAGSVIAPPVIAVLLASSGIAYGLLTYNTVTDIINNKTLSKWYHHIMKQFENGLSFANIMRATASILLVSMAVALTLCTAGTWWTVAKAPVYLYRWTANLPKAVMHTFNPLILAISAGAFNISNSHETFELLTKPSTKNSKGWWQKVREDLAKENILQKINPFRILLLITVTPLRMILFIGHLASIGVTADRVPGIPNIVSAIFGTGAEWFEDLHYFFGAAHHHTPKNDKERLEAHLSKDAGHHHDNDIPTKLIKFVFLPLYFLSFFWDWTMGQLNHGNNEKPKENNKVLLDEMDVQKESLNTSVYWDIEHTRQLIQRYTDKHYSYTLIGKKIAQEKKEALLSLKDDLPTLAKNKTMLKKKLELAAENTIYSKPRSPCLFNAHTKTSTTNFVETLAQNISVY